MTSINSSAMLPSQMAMKSDASAVQSDNSFISNLANVKPDQAAALADKTFLALGKDGIKFLPFLTSFVNAFKQSGAAPGSASPALSSAGKADVGAATQSLLSLRNTNSGVKDLDQAIASISKALPNLTQADFDSILANLKTASASAQAIPGGMTMAANSRPEIDKFELSLLEGQIAAAVNKNSAAAGSQTGNKALDAVIGAISEIGNDGVTADEMKSLVGILSATASALLGPEKAASVLSTLDSSANSNQAGSPQIIVNVETGSDQQSSTTAGGSATNPAGPSMGRNSYDPMLTVKTNLRNNAASSNWDPSSTNVQAYNLFIAGNSALSGGISSGQEFSKSMAANKKPVSSVDLS
jgi:hypothetical protein